MAEVELKGQVPEQQSQRAFLFMRLTWCWRVGSEVSIKRAASDTKHCFRVRDKEHCCLKYK